MGDDGIVSGDLDSVMQQQGQHDEDKIKIL
jgi:hypothetical protein